MNIYRENYPSERNKHCEVPKVSLFLACLRNCTKTSMVGIKNRKSNRNMQSERTKKEVKKTDFIKQLNEEMKK